MIRISLFAGLILLASIAHADTPATQPAVDFLRLVENDDGSAALQTSVVTFARGDARVHLYAAVHIGDRAYYDALNTAFANYQVVLYEMVKPRHVQPPPPGQFGNGGGVNMLQRMMQHVTRLEYQLDIIDYTKRHFVHADMDFETFAAAMNERNEVSRMMLRALTSGAQTQTHPDVLLGQFMLAAKDPAQAVHLKRMLAREFANLDQTLAVLEGPDGSVLVNERNKAAVAALEQQLRAGRTHIALFYGAAHVPDLGRRLTELGFEPVETAWLIAWDIPVPPAEQQ